MDNRVFFNMAGKFSNYINPFGATAQCNWETRTNGKPWVSELFLKANNAAGLKAWEGWDGEVYTKVSWEQTPDGRKVNRASLFCKYPSIEEFLANYSLKISRYYPLCVKRRDNFWGYFDGLFRGKYGAWATDATYFRHLAETTIAIAPDIFGTGWQAKIETSLEYAIDKKYLTPQHEDIVLAVVNKIFALRQSARRKTVVCLDFGHGGRDPGAAIPGRKDISEKDINLAYGQIIGANLSEMGYDVMYTRVGDEYVQLAERGRMAQNHRPLPSAFLSIHANSAARKDASGIEIYTYFGRDTGDTMANKIIEAIRKAIPGIKINDKEKDLAVLRNTPNISSALIELGFLSNEQDRMNLLKEDYRKRLTGAIANGINAFLGGA